MDPPSAATDDSPYDDKRSSAAYGGGQYLLAWTSTGGGTSGGDVYARFVAGDASSMGPVFAVAAGGSRLRAPRAAWVPAGGGTFAVAHRDRHNVVLKRFNSAGTLLGSVVVNNAATTNRLGAFDVATNGADRFCVVWTGWLDGTDVRETWAEIRDAAGGLVKDDTKVAAASAPNLDHHGPAVVWNGTLSEWAFTWEEFDAATGTSPVVEAIAWDAGLTAPATPEIAVSSTTGRDADLAWNSTNNEYLVVWTKLAAGEVAGVHSRRIAAADGSLVGEEFAVETSPGVTEDPAVAYSPEGNRFIVAFERKLGAARGAYAQVLGAEGAAIGGMFALSDDAKERENEAALARNTDNGEFLATWTEKFGGARHIWKVRLDVVPPAAPTGVSATAGADAITLSWPLGAESDLDLYRIFRGTTPGGPYTPIATVEAPGTGPVTYDDATAALDTPYFYVVRAVDLRGNESGDSNEASAEIDTIAPAAPTGLTATADADSILLSWTLGPEADIETYKVFRGAASGGPYAEIASLPAPASGPVTFDDTTASPGVPFFYVVRAVDGAANVSPNSNEATATVPAGLPAPTGLIATGFNRAVGLSWDAVPGAVGYCVYRQDAPECPFVKITPTPVATTAYTDTPLTNGQTYCYKVTAVAPGGAEGEPAGPACATPRYPKPPGLTLDAVGPSSVGMHWGEVVESDLDGYRVHRSQVSGGPYGLVSSGTIEELEFADMSVGAGTYFYVVTAISVAGEESAYSNEISATVTEGPVGPPTLASSNTRKTNDTTPKITGTTAPGFLVKLYEGATFIGSGLANSAGLFEFSTTDSLGEGEHVIQATTQASESDPASGKSSGVVVTVDLTAPAPPGCVTAVGTASYILVRWNKNEEADLLGYHIHRRAGGSSDPWVKLNDKPLTLNRYMDRAVTPGASYEYKVEAVDDTLNEAGP
jgi:fibronectin type 3 domain-containing protein